MLWANAQFRRLTMFERTSLKIRSTYWQPTEKDVFCQKLRKVMASARTTQGATILQNQCPLIRAPMLAALGRFLGSLLAEPHRPSAASAINS
jgi:hypothetical protein